MRLTSRNSWLSKLLEAGVLIIILFVPFNATLTVWLSSFLGHYTLIRLWSEILLAILFIAATILAVFDKKLLGSLIKNRLFWLSLSYAALFLIIGLYALERHQVNLKALGYSLVVDLRFIVFFWICFVAAAKSNVLKRSWAKILLIPSLVVVVFGLFQQFLLPSNFLNHFGYGPHTISPFETVDQNTNYIRVQSTLRGPNPLGAYLVVIAAAVSVCFVKIRQYLYKGLLLLFGIAILQVLVYTYSRSALIGVLISVSLVGWFMFLQRRGQIIAGLILATLVIIGSGAAYHFRNNTRFDNTFFHTSNQTHSIYSSDQSHESSLLSGISDILHQPLGRGPGTAGPASAYNNHPGRIPENYYVQIGQEVGIIGLVLFLGIVILLTKQLWRQRDDPLSAVMLYSFIGLFVVNFVSLAWTDSTLAYIWWGLAGIACYPGILEANQLNKNEAKKIKASVSSKASN